MSDKLEMECVHDWRITSDHALGTNPTMVTCDKCKLRLEASNALSLDILTYMKTKQYNMALFALIVSVLAVLVAAVAK